MMDTFDNLISDSVFKGMATWDSIDEKSRGKLVSAFLKERVEPINIYECVTESDSSMELPMLVADVLSGAKSQYDLATFIIENAKTYYRNDIDEALENMESFMMDM